MLPAEGGPDNLQGVLGERLCFGMLACGPKHNSKVVEAESIVWMLPAESGPDNLQGVSEERLCLGILARGLKHTREAVEHSGGFRRPLAVLAVGELQQLFEMPERGLVLRRPLRKYSGGVEMVIGRIQARGLVKVRSCLAPFDLNGGNLSSLKSGLGGAHDSHVRTVFNLRQQRIGLREIPGLYGRTNLRTLLAADIVTKAGQIGLQFANLPQRVGMSGLNIGQLAFDLCELILQQAALVTVRLGKALLYLSLSFFQYSLEIFYGQANFTARWGRNLSFDEED